MAATAKRLNILRWMTELSGRLERRCLGKAVQYHVMNAAGDKEMHRVPGVTWLHHQTPMPLVEDSWMQRDLGGSKDK